MSRRQELRRAERRRHGRGGLVADHGTVSFTIDTAGRLLSQVDELVSPAELLQLFPGYDGDDILTVPGVAPGPRILQWAGQAYAHAFAELAVAGGSLWAPAPGGAAGLVTCCCEHLRDQFAAEHDLLDADMAAAFRRIPNGWLAVLMLPGRRG